MTLEKQGSSFLFFHSLFMEDRTADVRAVVVLLQHEGNKIKHQVSFLSKHSALQQQWYETIKSEMFVHFCFFVLRLGPFLASSSFS